MSISTEILRIQGNVADAYTAANAKGATMPVTQNSDNLASTIATIPTGGTSGKYQLLDRVKDDTDKDIGCVVGYHTDANNQKYAVVCLNGEYRGMGFPAMLSSAVDVTGIPKYSNLSLYDAPETATKNCDEILATATAQGLTSAAVNFCRNKSFVIDGTTYYGQVPSASELLYILINRTYLNANDPSSGQTIRDNWGYWTSTQANTTQMWVASYNGIFTNNMNKNNPSAEVLPILEIPNA